MNKKRFFTALSVVVALILTCNGCSSIPSNMQIQDVSHFIQNGKEADTDTHTGFYFEMLDYHKQCLYMKNGYTLSKWVYKNNEYTCQQTILASKLFPQEYQNIDQTIDYINNGEVDTLSCDGRFICIFDANEPHAFYFWDTESDALYNIKLLSSIKKIQWADDASLLYLLTEENKLYCLDPVSKNVTETSIKTQVPDVNEENIHLIKDGIIYYDGLQVLFANSSENLIIVDNVSGFYGAYKNTLVVNRTDNKVEAGFIEDKWNPFYSEQIYNCNPINGQYLQIHTTDNQDKIGLLDLTSGKISSFETFGYGYEVFPNTNAIMFFDSNGTPCVQKTDAAAMPIQLGVSEPFLNNTAIISILNHEADNKMNLQLFSEDQWQMFNINNKGDK